MAKRRKAAARCVENSAELVVASIIRQWRCVMPRSIYLCLFAIGLLTVSAAAQDRKLQDELIAQEEKVIRAINAKGKEAIARLLADEAISITASRGRQTTN